MNKKILSLIFVFFIFLFFSSFPIFAQTKLTIPGLNCGDSQVSTKNQCCVPLITEQKFISPDLGPLNVILNPIKYYIDYMVDTYVQPLSNSIYSVSKGEVLPCYSGVPSTTDYYDDNCKCLAISLTPTGTYIKSLEQLCFAQEKVTDKEKCLNCANDGGIWSGIGCIYTNTQTFIQKTVFRLGIGLAGGFSILCIIYAAFMMQSSQGNPEKIKKAQEMITSCIMGLMLIIFSVFILRLVGFNILQIPGFN